MEIDNRLSVDQAKPSGFCESTVCTCIKKVGLVVPIAGIVIQIASNRLCDQRHPAKADAKLFSTARIECREEMLEAKRCNKISLGRNIFTIACLVGVIAGAALGALGSAGGVVIGLAAIVTAVVVIDSLLRIKAIRDYDERQRKLSNGY